MVEHATERIIAITAHSTLDRVLDQLRDSHRGLSRCSSTHSPSSSRPPIIFAPSIRCVSPDDWRSRSSWRMRTAPVSPSPLAIPRVHHAPAIVPRPRPSLMSYGHRQSGHAPFTHASPHLSVPWNLHPMRRTRLARRKYTSGLGAGIAGCGNRCLPPVPCSSCWR